MSDCAIRSARAQRRAEAPYAERADARETAVDRFLHASAAGLRRPFSRSLARARAVAEQVEAIQPQIDALDDAALREAAIALRAEMVRQGSDAARVARAFALVRAAAGRTLGLRHFPAQLVAGHVMLQGLLAEMGTGEGKTLSATLPAATAALAGVPVHVVTVNGYLAERDAGAMGPLFAALGLSTGVVRHGQSPQERQAAYACDICYCTHAELGFDYLRDSLALGRYRSRARLVLNKLLGRGDLLDTLLLRGLHFAIVDEADSVLIDEARTPLIIAASRDTGDEQALYGTALSVADALEQGPDYVLDASERTVRLTRHGQERLKLMAQALPAIWRSARGREELAHQALTARHLFERDTHYVVQDGKVQIVDEYSGRILADRTWERGLQQLIEVKEQAELTGQRTTLARVTYQRLFRRYLWLAGMTGTGMEVAAELKAVYGLDVAAVPSHRPLRRSDAGTRLYLTHDAKWQVVADTLERLRQQGRPVLVGTRSVAASEELARILEARGLEHVVLNARQDSEEANIVAMAGEGGRITIATNMAGRGTDIRLGEGVAERGGLHVILTEFHESARVDRQLFGRCARQGEPGSHEAIVSLQDEVFARHARRFAGALAARYASSTAPLPSAAAWLLKTLAQNAAERSNSHVRRATLQADRQLDTALAFTGRTE
ncbi:MAG TPA: prepilin peptidase [Ramlibacter sp.]|nr:prepilin peptidase [Ramlibacter sp.]